MMSQIIEPKNQELFTELCSEESTTINGGNAAAASTLAAFLAANGTAKLTPTQAIIVIVVALI